MLRSVLGFLIAFLVSWLPEPVKSKGWLRQFNSPAVHVFSGLVETVAGMGWLFFSFLRSMDEFNRSFALALSRAGVCVNITETDIRGSGVLGFVAFLFHPLSIVCYAIVAEGLIRSLAAFLTDRTPGTFFLSVPRALLLHLAERKRNSFRRSAVGPPRPDELRPADSTQSGLLEIVSAGEKPWHDRQVLEYGGEFYLLDNRQWIRQGELWALCYRFRPMNKGEIIRGSLVRY